MGRSAETSALRETSMGDLRASLSHRLTSLGVAVATGLTLVVGAASPVAAEGAILGTANPNAIPGSYLVTLRDTESSRFRAVPDLARELADRYGGKIRHVYSAALRGFAVTIGEPAARRLAADPGVRMVERDGRVSMLWHPDPDPVLGLGPD